MLLGRPPRRALLKASIQGSDLGSTGPADGRQRQLTIGLRPTADARRSHSHRVSDGYSLSRRSIAGSAGWRGLVADSRESADCNWRTKLGLGCSESSSGCSRRMALVGGSASAKASTSCSGSGSSCQEVRLRLRRRGRRPSTTQLAAGPSCPPSDLARSRRASQVV